ncbi:hypothetical protein [Blastopirellula marina]|uniref:PilZ domain-containing protein n=1 Tax=Blastopirellula marina TaxID=124 RepID=A0A2S8FHQ7_9BACT|nr:hypothetical protein [Blastopirellula marina]PQO31696.1 hypothetical protein C5Y98_19985 [Blastopirellula marina]PTL43003.1 hypothetical protein C5Y97_19995 [Blastopirellula marina]
MRFAVAPTRVKARLQVGRDWYKAELLDESMAGFALSVEVPRRKLGENGFTCEAECPFFGEIARLAIEGHTQYEIQIISIVPREDESSSTTKSRVSLRLGTRVVREIYQEDRNSLGRNMRLITAMAVAVIFSFYCTAHSYSGQLAEMLPQAESALGQLSSLWSGSNAPQHVWKREIAHATAHGFVVPGTPAMDNLLALTKTQPSLQRVQKVILFRQDSPFLQQMNLNPGQLHEVRKIAMEASAEMERLWQQLQNHQEIFQQRLSELLVLLETRILANLTPAQAELWIHAQFA